MEDIDVGADDSNNNDDVSDSGGCTMNMLDPEKYKLTQLKQL